MSTSVIKAGDKRAYNPPSLTRYGSVRDLTGGSSGTSGDGATMMPASDRSYKENIVRVGEHPAGFGIYTFDYKSELRDRFGHGRQFGVMADEVEQIVPEAIMVAEDGYLRVDYARLGITQH